jgi:hypothetical protein
MVIHGSLFMVLMLMVLLCCHSMLMVYSIIAQNWSGTNYYRAASYWNIDITNLFSITFSFGLRYVHRVHAAGGVVLILSL